MRRLVTWMLVGAVVVLCVQDRKKAVVLKELQKQRRWVVEAREEWAGYREMMELHDGEREVLHERMNRLEGKERETRRWETGRDVGLHNEY